MRFSSVVSVGSEPQLGLPVLRREGLHHSAWTVTIWRPASSKKRLLDLIGLTRQSMDGDVEGRGRLKVRPFITRTTCDYY